MHQLADQIESIMPTAITGCVARTEGTTAAVAGFPAPVGALAEIERQVGAPIRGEVIGFRDQLTLVYPFSSIAGVRRGNRVRMVRTSRFLRAGKQLLGRVIDAHGDCVDGMPQPVMNDRCPLDRRPPEANTPAPIDGHPSGRRFADLWAWTTSWNFFWIGCRQERLVGDDGPPYRC